LTVQITFLGTGGDKVVAGKQTRATGGIIIKVNDNQFHIDPGPGALVRAKEFNINLRENTAVFLTHEHLNHSNDINAVLSAMTHGGMDQTGVLITNKENNYVTDYHKLLAEKSISLKENAKIGINEVDIITIPAKHYDTNCIGLKFYTQKVIIGYTSDTGYTDELATSLKDCDVIIANCKFAKTDNENHLNTEDVIKLVKKTKPKLIIITHFGKEMLESNPLSQARKITRQTKIHSIAAKDGLVVSPVTYAKSKQKSLRHY
jgi:ribonuclease BN (tRNA processing enzyme)